MSGCFCVGPQNGQPHCPCAMREGVGREWREIGPSVWHRDPPKEVVATGWKCVVCGKGNAPFMPTCGNPTCGVDLSKGATA